MAQMKNEDGETVVLSNGSVVDESLALKFAKAMAEQRIHDPSGKTSRRKSRSYSSITKEDIEDYLAAPTTNEKNLRNGSIYLYQTSTRYRNLLSYYSDIPCWIYTITPVNYNPDKQKKENFKKQYLKVCNILESMDLERTMKTVVVTALREGAYYGCIWGGNGDSFILQKLDPDYCQIVSVSDGGVFQFTYDMSQVKEADLDTYYPPQFRDMYNNYQNDGNQYQVVPPEISVCFKADPSIVEYSIPIFSGILPTLFQIKAVEELQEDASEISNYKLLAGKIPVDSEGVPLLTYETAMEYYNHLANNVGERVGVAVTPFDLKDYSFEQSGTTAQIDDVARANENFFAAAGTSALLHGATNDTSGVTKLSIKVDEAMAFSFMHQCEAIINRYLKLMSGTTKFKINFLDISVFNRDEMIDKYKNSMNYGVGKLEYFVTMGIPQYDIMGKAYIENDVIGIDSLSKPMATASTQSSDDSSAGRPEATDSQISDSGEITRDSGANENR